MEGKDDTKILGSFYLEKEAGPMFLYLANPENSNKLVLAKQDFSASQTWRWANNTLLCDTGKVLDIDGNFKAGQGAPLLAWEPHGGENQKFCPFKIVCQMTGQEHCFIGRLTEEDVQGDRLFLTVPEEGPACLETVDSSHLFAKNMRNTIEMCWKFVFRQIEVIEENQRETESPIKVESLDTAPYQWVEMGTDELPENALAAGKDQSEICNVFVGRAEVYGIPCVGKVHNGTRYFGSIMREMRVTSEPFAVLCVDPSADMEWVEYKEGELPAGVVFGGTSTSGTNIYVGRGIVKNQLIPGMVYIEEKPYQLHALYDGKVNTMTAFEVLVIKPEEATIESKKVKEDSERSGEMAFI